MGHSKFNRYERKQMQQEKIAQSLAGAGLFVFKNPSRTGTLTLPKPTASGRRTVGPQEEFQGDSYFMNLVNTQDLIKVRTLITPEQERAEKVAAELAVKTKAIEALAAAKAVESRTAEAKTVLDDSVLSEAVEKKAVKPQPRKVETVNNPKAKKLVLDQPDRVTTEGKVENVVREEERQKLHDHDNKRQHDVLLNEHPAGEIIIE